MEEQREILDVVCDRAYKGIYVDVRSTQAAKAINENKDRKTKHTHHPVDDAKGNAEALLYLVEQGLKIKL